MSNANGGRKLLAEHKRLALFLDGTWNTQDDNTNVWRLKLMLAPHGDDGVAQLAYYDPGVGTHWYDRLTGGAFGQGASDNIRHAYEWLMEEYAEGDEIYVFGFSRGAYTARSLTGIIAKCGLLLPGAPLPVVQVYERYARGPDAVPLYHLEYEARHQSRKFDLEETWLLQYSRRVAIKFTGVWDTVGSLGVPVGRVPGISRKSLGYHFTHLSKLFENAYQALAVDEQRADYWPVIWKRFTPKSENAGDVSLAEKEINPPQQNVEQRWFIGAHANVGGGYRNDPLNQIPLKWIQDRAADTGLAFRQRVMLSGGEYRASVRDSYAEFLHGAYRAYRWLRFKGRYYRTIQAPREEKATGWLDTVNETVDDTVFQRWSDDAKYRPRNLLEWAQRTRRTLP